MKSIYGRVPTSIYPTQTLTIESICNKYHVGDRFRDIKYLKEKQMSCIEVIHNGKSKDRLDKIKENFGGLHIAVNCAGTGYPGRILGKEAPHPLDAFQFIVNLNHVIIE